MNQITVFSTTLRYFRLSPNVGLILLKENHEKLNRSFPDQINGPCKRMFVVLCAVQFMYSACRTSRTDIKLLCRPVRLQFTPGLDSA